MGCRRAPLTHVPPGSCSVQLVDNSPMFKPAAAQRPLLLLPGKPPRLLPLDQPLSTTGAVKPGSKEVRLCHRQPAGCP